MKIDILVLPDSIYDQITKDNWEQMFNEYMVSIYKDREEYIWQPEEMRKFIRTLLKTKGEK